MNEDVVAYSTATPSKAVTATPAAHIAAVANGARRAGRKAAPAVEEGVNTNVMTMPDGPLTSGKYGLTAGRMVLTDPRAPGIELFYELLTPELAEHYLQKLPKEQRKQSPRSIDRYSNDMRAELWLFIADVIRFNADEELIDGQHRCQGVIESGIAQLTLVVVGLERGTIAVFDTGRPRTFTDMLTMKGVPNAAAVSAVTKRVFDWRRGNYAVTNIGRVVNAVNIGVPASPGMLWDTYSLLSAPIQHAAKRGLALSKHFARKSAAPGVLSFVYLLFGEYDVERREVFFHELEYGPSQNGPEYPMFTLRERLKKPVPTGQSGLADWVWVHFFFTTWNAMVNARSLGAGGLKTPSRAAFSHVAQPIDPHADTRPANWQPLAGRVSS